MGISCRIRIVKAEKNKDGLVPIKLILTIDRKTRRFHLGKFVHPNQWIGQPHEYVKSKGKNKHPNARYLNLHLSNKLTIAQRIILKFEEEDLALNFANFKAEFFGDQRKDFFDWHKKYVENQICLNVAQGTIKGYGTQARKLKKFSKEINLRQISPEFIQDYVRFLKNELGNHDNTIYKSLIYVRSVFKFARKNKAVSGDPFEDIIIEQTTSPATYLDKEEVDRLMRLYQSEAIKDSWQNVLRMFLWTCFTGQSYKDVALAKYSDIIRVGEYLGLSNKRYKTNVQYFVPLFEEALYLLGDFPEDRDQLIFRSISNQKVNIYLKEVVQIVKIKKRVTFHTGRHSFGHSLIRKGVNRSYIKEMLGHSSIIMTEHYSKVMDIDIINNLKEKWHEKDR